MSRTYKATGINLKGMPIGETDRLITILTPEFGLVRAVAPGARKHKSRLRGRSELFVVNQLLIVKGRSLDKIIQAETLESYPGLSRDLGKLAASQYLAELVLCLALSEQPQKELYELLNEHIRRLEQLSPQLGNQIFPSTIFAHLSQAVFHILAIVGIGPQVHDCCLTQGRIIANFQDPHWRVGFSFDAGGIVTLPQPSIVSKSVVTKKPTFKTSSKIKVSPTKLNKKIDALELTLLQHLGAKSLPQQSQILPESCSSSINNAWIKIEKILRDYAQYHVGRDIRSADLVDALITLN